RGEYRLVIDLKRDANAQVVLNQLYKHTPMQTSFGVIMLALVDGVPKVLNLKEALEHYIAHQIEVITRRTQFRLDKARDRAHIVEGLLRALDAIDAIIALIRGSESADAARSALMAKPYEFSEIQANHILDMQLRRLAHLDLIEDEEVVVVLSHKGYVKTVAADAFRKQGRGGKGVRGSSLKDEDYVEHLLTSTAHSYLLFFSNRGKVYRL